MGALGAGTPFRVIPGGDGGTGQVQLSRQDTLSLLMECQAFCRTVTANGKAMRVAEMTRPTPSFEVLQRADQLAKLGVLYGRAIRSLTGQVDRAPKEAA